MSDAPSTPASPETVNAALIGCTDGLEAKCEDWTYKYENQWTQIRDERYRLITTFFRRLTHAEVYAFRAGWGRLAQGVLLAV